MQSANLRLPFLCCLFLAIALSVHAQKVFNAGDRVKVSPSGLKDEKYWRAGTVTEVHNYTPKKAYTVLCDPLTSTDHTSSILVNEDWIKPLKVENTSSPKNDAPQTGTSQETSRPAAARNTANKAACPASDPDSRGATPFERSIRGAIRVGFEREPQLNEDGKVTVTFQNVNIGPSHAWRELQDPIDAKGKTIYEVRSSFTTCTDYFSRIELVKRERAFACYKSNSGKWACEVVAAANTNIKDQTKSIDKKQ